MIVARPVELNLKPGTCDWSDSLQQRAQKSVNELRYE